MAKQTVLQEVKARMQEMQDKKAAELQAIHEKQTEAQTQKEAAELALKEATERMDLDAYEEAKTARRKAQTAIDMYGGRYKQISQQEYISEEESDKVIDGLLDYEKQLAEDFKAAVAEPLKQLAAILTGYQNEVADTERTISAWGANIHANYNTRGASTFTDPATGQPTHRSANPGPVHRMGYNGCNEAAQLKDYLDKAAGLY